MLGEEGLRIMENASEGEITDEEVARISEVKLTSVRRVLYKLYENRIAEYRTERDDNSGWITYLWSINWDKIKKVMKEETKQELANLKACLEDERKGMFYQCKCQRILFEEAVENNFKCDKCGSNFEYVNNEPLIKQLQGKIEVIEKWMKETKKE